MKKRIVLCVLLLLIVLAGLPAQAVTQLSIADFGDSALKDYLAVATPQHPWRLLAAIDYVEQGRVDQGDQQRLAQLKRSLVGGTVEEKLRNYGGGELYVGLVTDAMGRMEAVSRMFNERRCFPLPSWSDYMYENSWGAPRTYGGARSHLGIDLIVAKGTPVLSICDGTVTRKGWDDKGGWRIGVTDDKGLYHYYAHLSAYADVEIGDRVGVGQALGYVGSTGYGPEGTDNVMIPHLHVGLYENDVAVNPYPFLLAWEGSPYNQ